MQTVPQAAVAVPVAREGAHDSVGTTAHPAGVGWATLHKLLTNAEHDIRATAAGRNYADLVRRHFAEAQALVNRNRRVGTVWQHSGGPEIMNSVLEMFCTRDRRLPTEINGKSFAECLSRIQRVLARYASPTMSRDLTRYAPQIAQWSGMTFPELLSALHAAPPE